MAAGFPDIALEIGFTPAGTVAATNVQAAVEELDTDIALKAPLASPALTGNPTAPTQLVSDDSTRIATTAHVALRIAALIASSPALLDTLNELAAALGNDPNFATTMATALAGKASTGHTHTLDNLTDVVITTPAQFHGLHYNGTNWVNTGQLQFASVYCDTQLVVGYGDLTYLGGDGSAGFANGVVTISDTGLISTSGGATLNGGVTINNSGSTALVLDDGLLLLQAPIATTILSVFNTDTSSYTLEIDSDGHLTGVAGLNGITVGTLGLWEPDTAEQARTTLEWETKMIHPGFVSGTAYGMKMTTSSTTTTTIDRIYGVLFYVPFTSTWSGLGCKVASATAGSTVRLGIYAMNAATKNTSGAPLAEVTVSGATTGEKFTAFAAITLTTGWYYLVCSTTHVLGLSGTGSSPENNWLIGHPTLDVPSTYAGFFVASAGSSAALPTAPVLGHSAGGNVPYLFMRKA